jgi:hypothetical protein
VEVAKALQSYTIIFLKTKSLAFEEKSWASKIYMG